jgi:ubiquinone biosynthesis protein COQ9
MMSEAPSLRWRAQLLDALLPIAAEEGWTNASLKKAGIVIGLDEGQIALAAPGGCGDMIDAFADWADQAMLQALEAENLLALKVRERVRRAVLARLAALEPHKAAEAKAVQAMIRPLRAREGAGFVWRTADRIWRALGDASTDGNFYTKRAILSGVLSTVMARWLLETDPAYPQTRIFLDRRIDNVMQFEKLKRQAAPAGAFASLAIQRLAQARFGRD